MTLRYHLAPERHWDVGTMAFLEELTRGVSVKGILPDGLVTVVDVVWYGTEAVELTYKDSAGRLGHELLYREREATIELAAASRPWRFDGDGARLRLASEAYRIRLAYLFDPLLAVHSSLVEPLPHQITAVYGEMLVRQPLRFLLADDPGAGKTIMAGLLIKELVVRGDVQRCLIVSPGSLVEQWQDELDRRFHLPFEILTNDKLEVARTGNWFQENPLAIARLDKLSRNDDVQAKLEQTDWDLVIVDEAHKLSATFFGGEISYTKRYRLGQLLGKVTRHLLLLTATPHNGKEEDFQLFMGLLDADRFEGRFRDGIHVADTSDLMRRLTKEQLLKFDGRPLFPERIAYTVNYTLSDAEAALYEAVTTYVRQEFNRAEALENNGRKGTVGFALTTLQRRLASSPEAIYQSLRRRRERLQARLHEMRAGSAGGPTAGLELNLDEIDDLDDAPDVEVEQAEDRVVDQATAARTIAELEAELAILSQLEELALQVRRSGKDRKWDELSQLLQNEGEMFDAQGHRRKLVIFTEHRDTLNYLEERIGTLIGRIEAVVVIHGSMGRDERRKAQERFTQDPEVHVLIATDAAGEGINLQRAHLMANYDLPWNPNRLEQRFGRIHRIGQTEVCHLWNLVADETREGEVYLRLLQKLDEERKALQGRVFDVLGKLKFADRSLRDLLIEAVRYGDQPDVRARLSQVVDAALDRQHLTDLLEERALARDTMDAAQVRRIREDMERAEARRLQPHFIAAFFLEAFNRLGGSIREREPKRYEITHVPAVIRNRDRILGAREGVLQRYERVTFEKERISIPGKPPAAFICPGHPLLEATIDLVLERERDLLKRGAILVSPDDPGETPRTLFYVEHAIQDARTDRSGNRRVVSRQLQFVEIDDDGQSRTAGYAPYLDYRPLHEDEHPLVAQLLEEQWLQRDLADQALRYAISELVPRHFDEVRRRKEELVTKTLIAVQERLTKEIIYWDQRAVELQLQEEAGKTPRLNSARARQRRDELEARLRRRTEELAQERRVSPLPPVVIGGALVVPGGLLAQLKGARSAESALFARETKRVELAAMAAVMAAEHTLGFVPRDVSADKYGYDIESRVPAEGRLRFLEVKGRIQGATSVTVTKNEILTALNKPEAFILALVEVPPAEVDEGDAFYTDIADERGSYVTGADCVVRYVRQPFTREPDFGATSVNYDWDELWFRGNPPY
jgi:SNF2 family DNA or RNA helicase